MADAGREAGSDARGGVAVPQLRPLTSWPRPLKDGIDRPMKIFPAHQAIGADGHGDRAFGGVAHGEAGDAKVGGLLLKSAESVITSLASFTSDMNGM